MTHSTGRAVFWRLFWKEYRIQRALWLCIAVLAALLICLARVTPASHNDRLVWQFGIALILPAFYAAACGGLLFATEDEAGTYEFQRSLPLSPVQLLLGKCVFAVAGIVAMYAVAWCTAALLSGMSLGEAIEKLPAWALLGRLYGRGAYIAMAPGAGSVLLALELFLWSVLFSLLLRRPLTAALVGASAAAVAFLLMPWQKPSHEVGDLPTAALSARMVVVAILAALDAWLGLRWLGEQRVPSAMRISLLRRPVAEQRRYGQGHRRAQSHASCGRIGGNRVGCCLLSAPCASHCRLFWSRRTPPP